MCSQLFRPQLPPRPTNYHHCPLLAVFTLYPHLRNSQSLLSDLYPFVVTSRLLHLIVASIARLIVPCFEHIPSTAFSNLLKSRLGPLFRNLSLSGSPFTVLFAYPPRAYALCRAKPRYLCCCLGLRRVTRLSLDTAAWPAFESHCWKPALYLTRTPANLHPQYSTPTEALWRIATLLLRDLYCYRCCACRIHFTSCSATFQASKPAATTSYHDQV